MTRLLLSTIVLLFVACSAKDSSVQIVKNEETSLGELTRYDGDWFVAEHRTNYCVVTGRGEDWIETYFQGHGICGYFQWSMRMSYDLSTDQYQANIKWSEFHDGFNSHRKIPWQEYHMRGQWDPASQTLTWTAVSSSDLIAESIVKTVFDSPNHHVVSFYSDVNVDFPTGQYNFYRLW